MSTTGLFPIIQSFLYTRFRLFVIAVVAVMSVFFVQSCSQTERAVASGELQALNQAIAKSGEYGEAKTHMLDSLRRGLQRDEHLRPVDAWRFAYALAEQYRSVNSDSSLLYARRAISLAYIADNREKILLSEVAEVNALSMAGLFSAASVRFDSVMRKADTLPLKLECWKAGRQLFSYMRTYSEGHQEFYEFYDALYKQFDDSLLSHLPADDRFCRFIKGERLVNEGRYNEARPILEKLMDEVPEDNNIYPMSAFQLAEVYRKKGDTAQTGHYLVTAAIGDIKCGVKEGLALPSLASLLYSQGRFEDALRYINFALNDAASGNARMRFSALATMVPDIDSAYRKQIETSQKALVAYFTITLVSLVISVVLIIALRSRIRRIKANEVKLAETSKLQDSYIGNFLGLCSSYADRLDSLVKLVVRKLKAGQSEDLLKVVSTGRFLDEGSEDFYHIIDNSFLDLYPDFITYVNSLLLPECRIELKEKGSLTPELRIYAFVKLGVGESARIAQILHYSPNTVYAYRHRMRKRAINPETFDADILKSS